MSQPPIKAENLQEPVSYGNDSGKLQIEVNGSLTPVGNAQVVNTAELKQKLTDGTITVAESNILTGKGWITYEDSTYTEGSPLVIASARGKLTCDGLGSGTYKAEAPDGVAEFFNTTTNKILGINVGDACDIRIDFKAKCSTVSAYFDLELDIGGAQGIITARTLSSSKGAGNEQRYSPSFGYYTLATFVANGGDIYIDSSEDGTTVSIYDIKITIKRDYAAA